jgi:RimJ/RimL family protein N-acetyltransferase
LVKTITDKKQMQKFYNWLEPRANVDLNLETSSYIGFKENNKILGAIFFSNYDKHNIFLHVALDTPKICRKKNIQLMFDYIFNQAKCKRVTATCDNNYDRIKKLIEGVGFKKEGTIRSMIKKDNKDIDVAVYGMLDNECRWI